MGMLIHLLSNFPVSGDRQGCVAMAGRLDRLASDARHFSAPKDTLASISRARLLLDLSGLPRIGSAPFPCSP